MWRKLREAVLAVKLERHFTKEQILERYLNTIYFGRGAYGVAAATRAYFNHDLSHMQLQEAVYLAALIRSPETADVYYGDARPEATFRMKGIYANMVREGMVTQAEADAAEAVPFESYVYGPAGPQRDGAGGARGVRHQVLRRLRAPAAAGRSAGRHRPLHQGPADLHHPRLRQAVPGVHDPLRRDAFPTPPIPPRRSCPSTSRAGSSPWSVAATTTRRR